MLYFLRFFLNNYFTDVIVARVFFTKTMSWIEEASFFFFNGIEGGLVIKPQYLDSKLRARAKARTKRE